LEKCPRASSQDMDVMDWLFAVLELPLGSCDVRLNGVAEPVCNLPRLFCPSECCFGSPLTHRSLWCFLCWNLKGHNTSIRGDPLVLLCQGMSRDTSSPFNSSPTGLYQYRPLTDDHSFRILCLFPRRGDGRIEFSLLIAELLFHSSAHLL
jgi:hypothetical protein